MQRHIRKIKEELSGHFKQWHTNREVTLRALLQRLLPDTDAIPSKDELFYRLAPLLEPTNDAEKQADEALAAGRAPDDSKDPSFLDFIECREVFYLQRALVTSALEDLKSNGRKVTEQELQKELPDVFIHPHLGAITNNSTSVVEATKSSTTKRRRKEKDENEGEKSVALEWFIQRLLQVLLVRDLLTSFNHLTSKNSSSSLSSEDLFQMFQSLGMPPPPKDMLDEMLKDAKGAKHFKDVFHVIKDLIKS